MFATTYVCEKLFSTMKIVKTKFRSRLTDKYLRDQLRLAGFVIGCVRQQIKCSVSVLTVEVNVNKYFTFLPLQVLPYVSGKGQLIVDILNKLRDFSRKLTLFVSQFREENATIFLKHTNTAVFTSVLEDFECNSGRENFRSGIGDRTQVFSSTRSKLFSCTVVNSTKQSLPSKETLRGHSDSSFRGKGYIQCCVGVRLCDMYSNQELAEIHFMYGKADGNAALARRFVPGEVPTATMSTSEDICTSPLPSVRVWNFNSPGLGRGRPRSTTPEVQEEILEAVNMTPSINTRRVALQVNVPHTTVWRLLKEYQLYPYHLQRV
ncbi:hypothetical protein ANN_01484 [Periplaneta americana]|uniref:Uncharacterized protein n=1 Tax=Periplaneta americana TaxID=6978 RepID=A0ABQ8TWL2_PERAM|nr:hypothetical protein ANN_01484 [Periplaneta americana]